MEIDADAPPRCPKCNALVIDRRSPTCTTCRELLPAEWIFSATETAKLNALDAHAKSQHAQSMQKLGQFEDPEVPEIERIGDAAEDEST